MLAKFRRVRRLEALEFGLQILKHGVDAGLPPTKQELSQPTTNNVTAMSSSDGALDDMRLGDWGCTGGTVDVEHHMWYRKACSPALLRVCVCSRGEGGEYPYPDSLLTVLTGRCHLIDVCGTATSAGTLGRCQFQR